MGPLISEQLLKVLFNERKKMTKPTLHIPQKDSPSTYLITSITDEDNKITVADSSIFQTDPNNLITRLTLGFDSARTETVEVAGYNIDNSINIIRRPDGLPSYSWGVGTKVARVFTSNDLSEVHQYLGELNSDVTDLSGVVAELSTDVSVLTGDYDTEVAPILNLLSIVHQKRHIFRGAYLGSKVSEAQNIAIQTGTFENLYLGDYWIINNKIYRIADFNYWRHGINQLNSNHLVIIPDTPISTKEMDQTGENDVTYYDSSLRAYIISTILPSLNTLFGLKIAEYTENLPTEGNIVNEVTSKVELMSESQVYGQGIFRAYKEPTYSHSQFSLFKIAPEYIHQSVGAYWLRDRADAGYYCGVNINGMATYLSGAASFGIRPCFPIFGSTQIIG